MRETRDQAKRQQSTIDTYVWKEEHDFLYGIYDSAGNTAPKFRFPDLISACVSLVFQAPDPEERIFSYLRSHLVLRAGDPVRRREEMWKPQYELLLGLQLSRANKHPHPQFQLDQLTTACIALVRDEEGIEEKIFDQARRNTAERARNMM